MDLYQELILEHSKRPLHAGLRDPFDAESHQINTTCGDEITLRVRLDGDTVQDVSYDALGCAISIASASVLAQEVIGHDLSESLDTYEAIHAMLTSKGTDSGDESVIGDAVAFVGVSKYPSRVKCALLPWAAFTDALHQAGIDVSHQTTTTQLTNGRTA